MIFRLDQFFIFELNVLFFPFIFFFNFYFFNLLSLEISTLLQGQVQIFEKLKKFSGLSSRQKWRRLATTRVSRPYVKQDSDDSASDLLDQSVKLKVIDV